ncbi:SDR family NAD(P)-dependent oxidoreductase, partial [Streptomyces boncukensis]
HTTTLPTYPFQHERYWLDPVDRAGGEAAADPADAAFWEAVEHGDLGSLTESLGVADEELRGVVPALSAWRRRRREQSAVESWRYHVTWKRHTPPGSRLSGTWLVVAQDGDSRAEAVAAALDSAGAAAAVVLPVAPGADRAGRAALAELLGGYEDAAGVVSLLAAHSSAHPQEPSVPAGLAATVHLLQALGDAGTAAPLWCLTSGAVSVSDGDPLSDAAQAMVWGLGRTAALEHPQRWGGLIDVPAELDAESAALLTGVLAGDGVEDQVALRDAGAYVRRLARSAPEPVRAPWKPRGTALITGGTGALGGHLARWLAERGAERVVLTSRRGPEADGMTELADELAAAGTELTVLACDVADRAAVAALLAELSADGHEIRSVFHAAGVATLDPLADLGVADLGQVLGAKVLGAESLVDLLDPEVLDRLVLFSSISGVWGVGDHAAYAAANAYLDALAVRARAGGLPVTSIAWGPWAGGGMIPEALQDTLRRRGVPVIEPATALGGLRLLLDHDETAPVLAEVDWERFASVFATERPTRLFEEIAEARGAVPEPESSPLAQRLAALSAEDRERELLGMVRSEVARVLGHSAPEQIDPGRAFKDIGFDSLTAVELRNKLGSATGLRLPTTLVFDHPNPLALAAHLVREFTGELDAPAEAAATSAAAAAAADDPIAVVGMGCRFPGGLRSPEELWQFVVDGRDATSPLPADRGWNLAALHHPDPDHPGTSYVREGGFLDGAADFDAGFFGISPREAIAMDPQQRLLLETSWEAIERAGIDPTSLRGSRAGVFVGALDGGYGDRLGGDAGLEGYLVTGGAGSVTSGRVSYLLGLEGPAVTLDTACSSSLVAMHLAAQSLRQGECSLALAGGVAMMSTPDPLISFSRQRGLAPDGRCKPFAAAADGFALSEGVGVLVLERLSDARANGHQVLAVLKGSAVNQDGASNGLTAP